MSDLIILLNQNSLLFSMIVFMIGLLFGSFYNVVIYRLPIILKQQWDAELAIHLGQSEKPMPRFNIAWPSSHCPHCQHKLHWWHNIPLISYIILKGQCHFCQHKISMRYPLVELLTATIWAILAVRYGFQINLFAALILSSFLIILMMIDFDTQLLPDSLTLSCLWIGLLFNIRPVFCFSHMAIYGAVAGYLTLWIISSLFQWIRKKPGMGHGDMKMLAMLGAWFGILQIYYCLFLAVMIGLAMAGFFLLTKKMKKDTPMPFGPALASAGLIFLIIQPSLPWPLLILS
ncbi:MAG: hypothetical protein A3F17_06270 [Gammaproteobacteria bacterium RIFCSPHIGHO2_12_FULL_41_15]|nr:MAG: hypothetical protein A3F17_06270 [Gammaproteobacteria bacterium RIFCSPHIGHO2_12_FULL_41_15]